MVSISLRAEKESLADSYRRMLPYAASAWKICLKTEEDTRITGQPHASTAVPGTALSGRFPMTGKERRWMNFPVAMNAATSIQAPKPGAITHRRLHAPAAARNLNSWIKRVLRYTAAIRYWRVPPGMQRRFCPKAEELSRENRTAACGYGPFGNY